MNTKRLKQFRAVILLQKYDDNADTFFASIFAKTKNFAKSF